MIYQMSEDKFSLANLKTKQTIQSTKNTGVEVCHCGKPLEECECQTKEKSNEVETEMTFTCACGGHCCQ
jgi:hypothetical protein